MMTQAKIVDINSRRDILQQFLYKGFRCEIKKCPTMGHLCGYVYAKVSPELHDVIKIHGGVTYNDGKKLGFDCAHLSDLVPSMHSLGLDFPGDTYKNEQFVQNQLLKLISQLITLGISPTRSKSYA